MEQLIRRIHKYKDWDELIPHALRELVKGVYLAASNRDSGKWRQNIRLSYDLVGFIPLNKLRKEETAQPKPCRFYKKQYYLLMIPLIHMEEVALRATAIL